MPAPVGQVGPHFRTPAAGEVEGGVIVLDQLESPAANRCDAFADISQSLRDTGVQGKQIALGSSPGGRQAPAFRRLLRGQRRPGPNAGPHSQVLHLARQARHVRKGLGGLRDRTRAISREAPAHVDHHKGAVFRLRGGQFGHERRILQAGFGRGIPPVSVIPVVAPVERLGRQPWLPAHGLAEGPRRFRRTFAGAPFADHHGRRFQTPLAQFHSSAAIAHVEPQADAAAIGLPIADGCRARLHSVTVGDAAARGKKVPGHEALARQSAPFEVAIAAFPGIAQEPPSARERSVPADLNAGQPGFRSRNQNCRRRFKHDLNIAALPIVARARQGDGAGTALGKRPDPVRSA